IPRTDAELLATGLPWPTSLLPQVGPLLMLLLLVKLYRPKQGNDLGMLHVIGLLQVALGCVLAGEPLFGLLLLLYLLCALWSLHLFYLVRAQEGAAQGAPGGTNAPEVASRSTALAATLLRTGRLTLAVLALGLPLFLIAPRKRDSFWSPLSASLPAK